ncbi:MAG: peptide-methionine (S)-S-oxide reductase MsrA [Ignavibacteria bacterium]|nr:peptide-methionine (S)-S-oxide reductase MsrA [Ignavibacteria bacterium]
MTNSSEVKVNKSKTNSEPKGDLSKMETATLAGGCFWCIETIFDDLKGVDQVVSGYSGGKTKNPTYEQVSSGSTGFAEAVQITFDPAVISYEKLLEIFFHIHNPTTLNKQGADIGTQYRSAIFYNSDEQKKTAEEVIKKIGSSGLWSDPIVTEVTKFDSFYPAEDYHQDYYNNNKEKSYCSIVIAPKVQKFYKDYKDFLKEGVGE